jgi:hypothetical protein
LTPDSIQQKYAQAVVSTSIVPGCVQFLGEEKRFHTTWVRSGKAQTEQIFSALPPKPDTIEDDRRFRLGPKPEMLRLSKDCQQFIGRGPSGVLG